MERRDLRLSQDISCGELQNVNSPYRGLLCEGRRRIAKQRVPDGTVVCGCFAFDEVESKLGPKGDE